MAKIYTADDLSDFEHDFVILTQAGVTLSGFYRADTDTFGYRIDSPWASRETDNLPEALRVFNNDSLENEGNEKRND